MGLLATAAAYAAVKRLTGSEEACRGQSGGFQAVLDWSAIQLSHRLRAALQGRWLDPKSPEKQLKIEGLLASAATSAAVRRLTGRKRPAEDDLQNSKQYWPSQWFEAREEQQAKRQALLLLNT